jgi:hypothetical protein
MEEFCWKIAGEAEDLKDSVKESKFVMEKFKILNDEFVN